MTRRDTKAIYSNETQLSIHLLRSSAGHAWHKDIGRVKRITVSRRDAYPEGAKRFECRLVERSIGPAIVRDGDLDMVREPLIRKREALLKAGGPRKSQIPANRSLPDEHTHVSSGGGTSALANAVLDSIPRHHACERGTG